MRRVDADQRRGVAQLLIGRVDLGDLRPLGVRKLTTKRGLNRVVQLVVLQHQRIGRGHRRFDRTLDGSLLALFDDDIDIVRRPVGVGSAPVAVRFTVVDHIGQERHFLRELPPGRAVFPEAELLLELLFDCLTVGVADKGIHRLKNRVVFANLALVLDGDVGDGEHGGGEVFRGGDGALSGIRVEADFPILRDVVFGDEALFLQPLAEVLAHTGLCDTAFEGQFAVLCRPFRPGMRCQLRDGGAGVGKRGADVVPTQHDDLFKRIVFRDFTI